MSISLTTLGLVTAAALLSIVRMPQLRQHAEFDNRQDGPSHLTKRNNFVGPNSQLLPSQSMSMISALSAPSFAGFPNKHLRVPPPSPPQAAQQQKHLLERFVNRIFRRPAKADQIQLKRNRNRIRNSFPPLPPSIMSPPSPFHQSIRQTDSSSFPFLVADGGIIDHGFNDRTPNSIRWPSSNQHLINNNFEESHLQSHPGTSFHYSNNPSIAESNSHYSYLYGQPDGNQEGGGATTGNHAHWAHSKIPYHDSSPVSNVKFPNNNNNKFRHSIRPPLQPQMAPHLTNYEKQKKKNGYGTKLKNLIFYHGKSSPKHRYVEPPYHSYQYDHAHNDGDGMVETYDEHHYFDDEDDVDEGEEEEEEGEEGDEEDENSGTDVDEGNVNSDETNRKNNINEIETPNHRKYYTKFVNDPSALASSHALAPKLHPKNNNNNSTVNLLIPSSSKYKYQYLNQNSHDHSHIHHYPHRRKYRKRRKHRPPKPETTTVRYDDMNSPSSTKPPTNCPPVSGKPVNYHYHMYLVKQGEMATEDGATMPSVPTYPGHKYPTTNNNKKNHSPGNKKKHSYEGHHHQYHKVPKTTVAPTTKAPHPHHHYPSGDYQQQQSDTTYGSSIDSTYHSSHNSPPDSFYYQFVTGSSNKNRPESSDTPTDGDHHHHHKKYIPSSDSDYYNSMLMKKIFDLNPDSKVMPIENYVTESGAISQQHNKKFDYQHHHPNGYGGKTVKFDADKEFKLDPNLNLYIPAKTGNNKSDSGNGGDGKKKKNTKKNHKMGMDSTSGGYGSKSNQHDVMSAAASSSFSISSSAQPAGKSNKSETIETTTKRFT